MKVVDRQGNYIKTNEKQDRLLAKLYGTKSGRLVVKIIYRPWVTKIIGRYMNTKYSRRKIAPFINQNKISMDDYEEVNYPSYNAFFTRKIIPDKRPFDSDPNILISPADAKLSCYSITKTTTLMIKDTLYTLSDLLQSETLVKTFQGGTCLLFRLTVDDYHRYHYIDTGSYVSHRYIPGKFHTVNPIANDYYPIYKQNAREYSVLQTENFGTIIQMEVGALLVGKIRNHYDATFIKGQEKGYFEFGGSTILVLLQKNKAIIDADIVENTKQNKETVVLFGETIGTKRRDEDE